MKRFTCVGKVASDKEVDCKFCDRENNKAEFLVKENGSSESIPCCKTCLENGTPDYAAERIASAFMNDPDGFAEFIEARHANS